MEKQKLLKTTLSLATVAAMGQTGLLTDLVKPVNAVEDVTQTDYSKYEDLIKESEQRLEEEKENLDKVQAEYDEVNQAETDAKNTYEKMNLRLTQLKLILMQHLKVS